MHAHHVAAVTRVVFQTLSANVARKHLGVGMGRNVLLEIVSGVEALSALLADMLAARFCRIVTPAFVLAERRGRAAPEVALIASVRLLSRVTPQVLDQSTPLRKSIAAVIACMRSLVFVLDMVVVHFFERENFIAISTSVSMIHCGPVDICKMLPILCSVGVLRVHVDVNVLALRKAIFVYAVISVSDVFVRFGVNRSTRTRSRFLLMIIVPVPVGKSFCTY